MRPGDRVVVEVLGVRRRAVVDEADSPLGMVRVSLVVPVEIGGVSIRTLYRSPDGCDPVDPRARAPRPSRSTVGCGLLLGCCVAFVLALGWWAALRW